MKTKLSALFVGILVATPLLFTAIVKLYPGQSDVVYAENKICQKATDTNCTPQSSDPALAGKDDTCKTGDCIIDRYVSPTIKALSALVGVVATASIVYAGIQYSSAEGDAGKISAARKRISQTIAGLLAWLFLLTFLNWLMPGGLF